MSGGWVDGWPDSTPWQQEVRVPSDVFWAALRDKYPWLPDWERVDWFDIDGGHADIKCRLTDDEYAAIDAAGRAALSLNTGAWWDAMRGVAPFLPPAAVTIQDSCTMSRDWDFPGQRLIGFRVWLADGTPRAFVWEPKRHADDSQ